MILQVQDVSKRFSGLTALSEVSFETETGMIKGLIGPNGAGKTTLFNIITGVFPPDEGEIFCFGQNISRKRPEDIPPLINHYYKIYASQFKEKQLQAISKNTVDKLISYHWPGNVRELQNVLKRILVMGNWEEIVDELIHSSYTTDNLTTTERSSKEPSIVSDILNSAGGSPPDLESFSLKEIKRRTLDKVEKEAISYVLGRTDWNRSKAAKILKISYKTLLYKISDLNIERPPKF